MTTQSLSQTQLDDKARLRELYNEWRSKRKADGLPYSQEVICGMLTIRDTEDGKGREITQSALSQYLKGKSNSKNPKSRDGIPLNEWVVLAFSELFECEPSDISPSLAAQIGHMAKTAGYVIKDRLSLQVNEPEKQLYELIEAPKLRPFKNVPVVGIVEGGINGYLEHFNTDDGSVDYPARYPDAYALRVRGDSMRPRIKSGEFIIAEPHIEPIPGDDVVVVCKDGRKMVKELLYVRNDEVTLGSINNGFKPVSLMKEEIESIHFVAAIIPRGAFHKP